MTKDALLPHYSKLLLSLCDVFVWLVEEFILWEDTWEKQV